MKIKEQTRKLAAGCSKNTVLRLQIELTWFEEIFEEYKNTTLCKFTMCGCILSLRPSSLHKEK